MVYYCLVSWQANENCFSRLAVLKIVLCISVTRVLYVRLFSYTEQNAKQ